MAGWLGPIALRPNQTKADAIAALDEIFGPDGEQHREELLKGLELMNLQFNAHGVELGQRYSSRAIVGDGTPFPPYNAIPSCTTTPRRIRVARCPHAWLGRDTHDISTLDLAAYDRFTLITGAGGDAWGDAAATVGRELGVEIATIRRSRSVPSTTTCSAPGPAAAKSPSAGACSCDPIVSWAGAAPTSSTTRRPRCAPQCARILDREGEHAGMTINRFCDITLAVPDPGALAAFWKRRGLESAG